MPRTLRNHTVVGSDQSVTVRSPELEPGAKVEVIVVLDFDRERTTPPGASFIDAIAGMTIDSPEDYSVKFGNVLYSSSHQA